MIQGGADLLRQQQGGGRAGAQPQESRAGGRPWGQWGDFLKLSMSVCFLFGPAILTILGPWHFASWSDQGRNAETVFSINSLLSKPLNPWTETKPDWLEYDCVAAQGLDQQTNFCLSSDYNHHLRNQVLRRHFFCFEKNLVQELQSPVFERSCYETTWFFVN